MSTKIAKIAEAEELYAIIWIRLEDEIKVMNAKELKAYANAAFVPPTAYKHTPNKTGITNAIKARVLRLCYWTVGYPGMIPEKFGVLEQVIAKM